MFLSEKKFVNSQKYKGLFHLLTVDYLTADLFIWTYIFYTCMFGLLIWAEFQIQFKKFSTEQKKKRNKNPLDVF